jgi:hypothetical protein
LQQGLPPWLVLTRERADRADRAPNVCYSEAPALSTGMPGTRPVASS